MITELQGKKVTVYLSHSTWGDSLVKGEVIEIKDSWLKLQGKKRLEYINLATIKRISI